MTAVFSFYNCARKYPRFLGVCDNLERFDHSLQLTPSKRWMTVKFTALIAILTVAPIISGGTYLYQILNLSKYYELNISRIILIACLMVATYIQICILVQFHEVTHCITTRLRLINDRIRQEVIIQSYRQLVLRQYLRCVNRGTDRSSNNKIKTFMSAYQVLREAVDQANAFYSDLLLSLICYKFLHITITLYSLFLFIESENPLKLIEKGIWTLCHICYLLQIVSSSSNVTQAADETSPIICKLINKDFDAGLKEQLESFLLQLAAQNVDFLCRTEFQDQQSNVNYNVCISDNIFDNPAVSYIFSYKRKVGRFSRWIERILNLPFEVECVNGRGCLIGTMDPPKQLFEQS
ncbi:gustatory receptor [Homalodisca vitripennis]|nr:gustatory receptor [Homalodisca vitripennis]